MRLTGSCFGREVVCWGRRTLGFTFVFAACAGTVWARDIVVPEIDPGSIAGAVGLFVGGMLLLSRKQPAREAAVSPK